VLPDAFLRVALHAAHGKVSLFVDRGHEAAPPADPGAFAQVLYLFLQGRSPGSDGAPAPVVSPHLWCLAGFDSEFRSFMEVVTGPTSDFTWAFMSLGYRKGGLGLRSARVHALGAYLASLTEASKMIVDRFSSVSSASVQARIEFLREDWSKAFGALPEVVSQKALSAASDERLFPLLQASPQCPPAVWVASLQSVTSACFWRCLPSHRAGTYVDNACFRTLVQMRYHQPVMYATECPAPGCTARLDVFGHHAGRREIRSAQPLGAADRN
jgi:hypothetical protein